ncbi:DinB family protein [Deinococcus arcticus]|uniref:DinB family protein n=1 Tax=Deinococcus arcticus TaxID=2136176 RepID=A0A2T3W597_9DEIO|nr:DinB family protein [Deinococcus arcticus]PTA67070.1 DinB family protein [Deinococcus arcticus]
MNRSAIYARNFESHRAALLDLYGQLPEDQGHFAAWDGGLSFIGQADHLSGSAGRLLSMIQGQAPGALPEASQSLTEARERLQQSMDAASQAMSAMSDEDLSRRVPAFGGREMPVAALLDAIIAHEAHHKGQVWVMARMVGVKPPMFVRMG